MPTEAVATQIPEVQPPAKKIKQFKVVGPRKVGVIEKPDATAKVVAYMESGTIFDVSMMHISRGLKYFRLADESGWLSQTSRKDPERIVVDQVDGVFNAAAILDKDSEDGSEAGDDSDSSSSSSSSS